MDKLKLCIPRGVIKLFSFFLLSAGVEKKMVRETKVVMKLTEEKNEWENDFPLIFFRF